MTTFVRILAVVAIAALTVGPVSAATVSSVASTTIAQDATTGSVSGTIRDNSGAPLANAKVKFAGPATYTTTSDGAGAFSIASVTPGIYVVTASKTGYVDAEIDDFAVIAGTTGTLNASLTAQTLTSLNLATIARVSARRGTSFNTSTASVNVVSAQQFSDNGSPQVTRVLNSIPGVQISLPSSSGNGAVPGAITFPNIRGALSYETASLIDGHPVSVGKYGDYVTTFFNANMLQGAEVIKGPGEMSPETNYAIGGTINFRTKDPTETMVPDYSFGVDNWGGTFSNFGISDTVGRLGFVLDFASISEPSAVNGAQVYFNPSTSGTVCPPGGGGSQCQVLYQSPKASYIAGTASKINDQFPLVACCDAVSGQYNNESELVKFRYKFSDATSLTASYLGSQSSADQNGNTSSLIPSLFTPAVAYNNPAFPANSQFLMSSEFPGIPENEYNNEPIFQAEAHTTIGNDTVLARYYHADISRIIQTAGSMDSSAVIYAKLYGVGASASGSGTTTYSGQVTPITFFNAYAQSEIDTLGGVSLEYQHPFSANNTLTLSAESTSSKTTTGSLSSDDAFSSGPVQPHAIFWSSITPQGSGQIFNTYLARDSVQVGRKLNATLSLYENTYRSTFPTANSPNASKFGPYATDGVNFMTNTTRHFDERFGATYRFNPNLIGRVSAGSSIAPPYVALLSTVNGTVGHGPSGTGTYTQTKNAGTLVPETAFGYDVGGDLRVAGGTAVVSGDIYLTNLYNAFISQTYDSGIVCDTTYSATCTTPGELYFNSNVNLSNERYEGVELGIKDSPNSGIGFNAAAGVQKAYTYNLGPCFYSTTVGNCSAFNTNLAIIPGSNSSGNADSPQGGGQNGFSNQSIPYLNGNAEINYRNDSGAYASFGATFYGKNNSYYEKPFSIGYVTVRIPLSSTLAIQVSGDNVFNTLSGLFPIQGGGVPIPLAGVPTGSPVGTPALGATYGNVLGPATWRFILTKALGSGSGNGRSRNSSR